jgi:hypothetical protein
MKYVRSYDSFKEGRKNDNKSESDKINEEFLGLDKLIGFFKGLFKKAGEKFNSFKGSLEELKGKVGELLSPKDPNSIANKAIEDFKKKPSANDEDCFTLIRQIMDPDDGAISDNNIAELFKTIKDESTRKNVQYTFEFARKETIKKLKYGGGKVDNWVIGKPLPKPSINNDLKTGDAVKRTPDNKGFVNMNHLPDLKNAIKGLDDTKKKDAALKFVDTIFNTFNDFCEAAQIEGGEEKSAEYKVGDNVVYKREKFNEEEWKKITDEDKKKPNEGPMKDLQDKENIGIKKISKIDGDKISFEGADFTKTKEDILTKVEGEVEKVEGQDDLVNTLKDVKTKNPEAIGDLNNIANLYKDPEANKDVIDAIKTAAKINK